MNQVVLLGALLWVHPTLSFVTRRRTTPVRTPLRLPVLSDSQFQSQSSSIHEQEQNFIKHLENLHPPSLEGQPLEFFWNNSTTTTSSAINSTDSIHGISVTVHKSPLFSAPKQPRECFDKTNNSSNSNEDSLEQFARDITTVLKHLRPHPTDPSLPKLFRNINMPSFTNIWSQRDWDLHTSRWRHLKYLWALPTSRLVRRIAPQLILLLLWSCMACWMCTKEFEGILSKAVLPLTPLSLVSTFVAALLTLRSNQGLSRLNEGRLAFGKVVLYTRDMAQLIATVIYPRNPQLGLLAARHVSLFGWLLKDFLRLYDEDYIRPPGQPYQPCLCSEEELVRTMLPSFPILATNTTTNTTWTSPDARYILSQRKKPIAICTRLRQIFAYNFPLQLTTSEQSRLDAGVHQLNSCITICERIRTSPIPPLYTAHAGRLLIFYLFFLPLALRGSTLLNNVGTILTTTVVGYAMLGLDEISHILEEPFRLMPLYHLSKNSMKDVADALVCMPPPLPVDGVVVGTIDEGYWGAGDNYSGEDTGKEKVPDYW